MQKAFTIFALLIAIAVTVGGQTPSPCAVCKVPEIDPGSSANALALIAGGLLILRGRRAPKPKA